jgi:hypothetical protein
VARGFVHWMRPRVPQLSEKQVKQATGDYPRPGQQGGLLGVA